VGIQEVKSPPREAAKKRGSCKFGLCNFGRKRTQFSPKMDKICGSATNGKTNSGKNLPVSQKNKGRSNNFQQFRNDYSAQRAAQSVRRLAPSQVRIWHLPGGAVK